MGIRLSHVVLSAACLASMATSAFGILPSVLHGYDLYQTQPTSSFGGVPLTGVPLGTFNFVGPGVENVGNTDTIVTRTTTGVASGIPGSTTITLQLAALQMETAVPANLGAGLGIYFITLQSARGGPLSTGTETINFNTANDGTFSSSLDVFFDIRFGALGGPIVQSSDLVYTESGDTWNRTPPAGATTISGVNLDLNTIDNSGDFFAAPNVTMTAPTGSQFVLGVPEPASLSILGLAGVALLVRRRR